MSGTSFMAAFRNGGTAPPPFVPTAEQAEVFSVVKQMGPGDCLAIEAFAGGAKTTTMVRLIPFTIRPGEEGSVLLLAFNRDNGKELNDKTPAAVKGTTFHAYANSILNSKKTPNAGKNWILAKQHIEEFKLRMPCVQLVSLAKNLGVGLPNGVDHNLSTWVEMIGEYGIRHKKNFTPERVARAAMRLFDLSVGDRSEMDFDDMLYWSVLDRVGDRVKHFDWILVDEAQDTNILQLLFLDMIKGPKTRLIFVGDRKQAIYGWRGAGVGSFDMMVARYRAKVLGLTVSQRCSRAVIREAQRLVPGIRAKDDAPEGSVERRPAHTWSIRDVAAGDVVLCRNNAPLLEVALQAARLNIRVSVAGKDLPKKVLNTFDEAYSRNANDVNDSDIFMRAKAAARAELADRPFTLANVLDEIGMAAAVWEIVRLKHPAKWKDYDEFTKLAEAVLKEIFFDEERSKAAGITLSTIHRAKGAEWDNVFLYRPELIPSKAAQKLGGWHLDQEDNLLYVGITRAKTNLILVQSEDRDE